MRQKVPFAPFYGQDGVQNFEKGVDAHWSI